jgi:RNA recognition motif-containing protein
VNRQSKGYGFIQFESSEDAKKAYTNLNGKTLENGNIISAIFFDKNRKP